MVDKGERIFLLEVFVDNVHLKNCKTNNKPVKICVKFKFLNYPFLEILEDEYCQLPDDNCNFKFQSGKSCLFSLRKNPQGNKKPPLHLNVTVSKKETETSSMDLGKTVVNLGGSFTNLIHTADRKPDNNSPVSRIIKEAYVLTDEGGQNIGEITLYVRLSCFGKIIVTQFQMSGLESKSFLFKAVSDIRGKDYEGSGDAGGMGVEPRSSSRAGGLSRANGMEPYPSTDKKEGAAKGYMVGQSPCGLPMMPPHGMMGPGMMGPGMMGPGMMGPGMMGPGMMGGPQFMMRPGEMPMMSNAMDGGHLWAGRSAGLSGLPTGQQVMGQMKIPPSMAVKPFGDLGLSPEEGGMNYKNITATVNGHVLNIKVLRKPKKLKQQEAVFCQKIPAGSSSDESSSEEDTKKKKPKCVCPSKCLYHQPPANCQQYCFQASQNSPQKKDCVVCLPNCDHKCSSPPVKVPLCDCDIPTPPCLISPPCPPSPPPKSKKKKTKLKCPRDFGMFCKADCPLGFPTPPGMIPPNYGSPSVMGASHTATGDPQNFLISMEPRTQWPTPQEPSKPTCCTVRDTQYEVGDFPLDKPGKKASKKGGKKK